MTVQLIFNNYMVPVILKVVEITLLKYHTKGGWGVLPENKAYVTNNR